jgi:hypothetical protein
LCCADSTSSQSTAGDAGATEQDFGIRDGGVRNQRDGITQKIRNGDLLGFAGADISDGQQVAGCEVNASKCG